MKMIACKRRLKDFKDSEDFKRFVDRLSFLGAQGSTRRQPLFCIVLILSEAFP